MTQRLRDLVATCERRPCKAEPLALSLTIPDKVVSDPGAMTAEAVISTDVVDYSRQIVLSSGMNLENYAQNPVVLYEHAKSGWPFPIAQSIDESGRLTITQGDLVSEAKSYHAETVKAAPGAYQFFALIDAGVIRATSVQVIPITKSVYGDRTGNKVDVIEESYLNEWSWCTLGVNPEALAKSMSLVIGEHVKQAHQLQTDHALAVLESGSLGNERLIPSIRKSLMSLIPPTGASSPGFDFMENAMNETKEPLSEEKAGTGDALEDQRRVDGVEKAMTDGDGEDTETKAIDGEEGTETDMAGDDGAADDSQPKPVPLGMQRLTELHAAVKTIGDHFEEVFGEVENEKVLSGVEGVLTQVRALQTELEGVYSEAYPDRGSLGETKAQAADDEADEFEAQMKSLIAGDQRAFFQSKGAIGKLRRLSELDSLPTPQRKELSVICKSLSALHDRAKSFEPPAPEGYVKKEEFEELQQKNQGLTQRAEKLLATVERLSQPAS